MFARSALRRAIALPQSSSPASSSIFRALTTTTPTSTQTQPPSNPVSAEPRAQFTDPIHQDHHPSTKTQPNTVAPESSPPTQPFTIPQTRDHVPFSKQPFPPAFATPLALPQSVLDNLPYLTSQRNHYITAHLHARPYLVTAGDHLRLPFLMPNVAPGDVLRLNRASMIGSRDFTLKGAPWIDERLFECRVRVLGVDAEPMRLLEKTKRRQRRVKTVRSKHKFTLLRVMDVRVKTREELVGEGVLVREGEEQPVLTVNS